MGAQEDREVGPCVEKNASTICSLLRNFTRMKHPMFFKSQVNEDPQNIINEVYKILGVMGLNSNKMAELASY